MRELVDHVDLHARGRGSNGKRGLKAEGEGTRVRRWIDPGQLRYYQANLVQDLFGEWTLVCVWGGLGTARGSYSSTGVASHEEGLRRLEALDKLRRQHGYLPVDSLADRPIRMKGGKPFPTPGQRRRNNPAQQELDLGPCT